MDKTPRSGRPNEWRKLVGAKTHRAAVRLAPFEYYVMHATMKALGWRERDVSAFIRTLILHEAELLGLSLVPATEAEHG